ncbi:DNA binding protein Ncp1 [Trichosporon asahii var. asahii CBS 8904]|uniref:DNA binding protein Ncp1 n=1 Tax=Trichosporon asahii var. asahii (strain CBS 8904) TaxID=1220162 RepID=K1VLT4_TRIAC|nr:DNA binding protein Ncp1 [Trichosporon asahii var. asahii CBS 8904]
MATATQSRPQGMTSSAPDTKRSTSGGGYNTPGGTRIDGLLTDGDNNSTRSGGYFTPSLGNKLDGTDNDGYYNASGGKSTPNGVDRHNSSQNYQSNSSQNYQNGHHDDDGSLSKGINSIGASGPNGYNRSASYSSNKRPGMNEQPSRSYIKNRDSDNHPGTGTPPGNQGNTTVTTTFVEFDDTTPSVTGGPTATTGATGTSTPGTTGHTGNTGTTSNIGNTGTTGNTRTTGTTGTSTPGQSGTAGGLAVPTTGQSGANTPGARSGQSFQSGTGVMSGPAAGGFFPTGANARGTTPTPQTPQGQGLNNSVNDNYVDRPGNQLHHDDDDVFGVNNANNANNTTNNVITGANGTSGISNRDLGPQETLGNVQKRPQHRHANKSHGSQYMIVENLPRQDSRATTPRPDYTESAAHWDPAAGAVVERSTPQHEYPPHIDHDDHHDQLSPTQDRRGSQQHNGLRNAGAAALGAGAGAAAGQHFANRDQHDHRNNQPYTDSRYHDDGYGNDRSYGTNDRSYGGNDRGDTRGVNFHDGAATGQRLPQTDGRDYSDRQRQSQLPQQRYPDSQQYQDQGRGGPTVAAVGVPGQSGRDNYDQDRRYDSYNDQSSRPRSRQTSFRDRDDYRDVPSRQQSQRDTLPKSHSDRNNLAAAATGAGIGAGVGAGVGSGMRRSASAGSGLIRGNRDRRASGGGGSIGHGSINRPSTADGYRDRDRFRRGNNGYDDRLPPVEDYDEDDEVRGLEPGQIVTPSRQRALQSLSVLVDSIGRVAHAVCENELVGSAARQGARHLQEDVVVPSTADGYRDRDRFRRGNNGYDDRLPPVEDYDEDDEVRGLEPGQIVTPSRQRALQSSTGRGGGGSDYDTASQQPRSRSAFGHRPQPGGQNGYDEFGAEDDGYGRPPTRAGTVRSTRSRRPGTSMSGAPRRGAFGQGAALSTGTNPHDVLSRQDLHERSSLAERALSPNELKRLQGMEKKDAKRLTKLMKEEERAQSKSLHQAIADMKRLTKLQKEAIAAESKSQRNLAKWTSREHKARLHFLKEKERYEAIEAKLRNAENDFEERRDHAYGLTEQVAERNQEIDDMRALKAADDRERAIKRTTLKHPGHA